MIEKADGVIERLFDRLIAGDWVGYGALLSPGVERIGPWGDRLVGRHRLVEMMAELAPSGQPNDAPSSTWDVHRIAYALDGRSGFARVTARPALVGVSQFEETLAFEMDDEGLVSLIEVFWQTPEFTQRGGGPITAEDG